MWEFFSSAWTLAIVPSAIAIAGVVAFAKTLLENRNLQLEKQRLQLEISAATRRIILPSESQIEKYGVVRVAMRRTVRLSGIVLAVLPPVSVALQTGPMSSVPSPVPPPPNDGDTVVTPSPAPPVTARGQTSDQASEPVRDVGVRGSPARPAPAPSKRPPASDPVIAPSPAPAAPPSKRPPAPAPPTTAAALVKKTLVEYERAAEALEFEGVKRIWPTAPDGLRNSYRNLRSQSVDLECAEPAITSDTATISCREQIRSVGAGGTTLPVATNTAIFSLRRNGDAWEIARISRQPR